MKSNEFIVANEQMVAVAHDGTCRDSRSVKRRSQREAILRFLEEGRILDQPQAVKELNCWRLSSRISELRKEGWNIESAYLESDFKGYWLGNPARIFDNSSIGQLPLFLEKPLNQAELPSQGPDAIEIHEEGNALNQSFLGEME